MFQQLQLGLRYRLNERDSHNTLFGVHNPGGHFEALFAVRDADPGLRPPGHG